MEKSLSNREIVQALGGKINLMTHEELRRVTPAAFLAMRYPLVLLFEHSPNYGHWVVLLKSRLRDGRPTVELFDSYGELPDGQRTKSGVALEDPQYGKALTRLLARLAAAGIPVSYNHLPLQKESPRINTCGRWVLARVLLRSLPLEAFAALFPDDETVTAFTEEVMSAAGMPPSRA